MNPLQHPVTFSCPLRIMESGWLEHAPFGLFVIDIVRPRTVVELGTQNGISYCVFCQAVKELGTDTRCYAIDTWQGDPQSGFYGEEVLTQLREHHDPLYGSFSQLVHSTFDQALDHFEDRSIDLLHIDGYHTYDAVQHDWQTWLPKMSERGVVLIHDIGVREGDFGVWRLWDELCPMYPHFAFTHGHGLGLLFVGEHMPEHLSDLLDAGDQDAAHIREFFSQLGQRLALQEEQRRGAEKLAGLTEETEHAVEALTEKVTLKDGQIENLIAQIADKDDHIEALTGQIADKDGYIEALTGQMADKDGYIEDLTAQITVRDGHIVDLKAQVLSLEKHIEEILADARAHASVLNSLEEQLSVKEQSVKSLSSYLQRREQEVEMLTEQLATWNQHWTGVQQSLAWSLVVRLRAMRQMMAPKKSVRERMWLAVMRAVRDGRTRRNEVGGSEESVDGNTAPGSQYTPLAPAESTTHGVDSSLCAESLGALGRTKIKAFFASRHTMVFPAVTEPRVSIVVPLWNKVHFTYMMLESLLAHTAQVPFEVILVDNGSTDETPRLLEHVEGVWTHVNESNLGFGNACNQGAETARGDYVCFLNNDILVTPGWLNALVHTMDTYPKCGAVGARLLLPDMQLQEAGGILWEDGSCLGYGRGDDPFAPEYSYVREVDYCSGACLLVRRNLFDELGGFDPRYSPAYYEDLDLCMAIADAGYKVLFNPQATIFHLEHGSSDRASVVASQVRNRQTFVDKWKNHLSDRGLPGPRSCLRRRDARSGKRVLLIDDRVPEPWIGSGFPRTRALLDALVRCGYVISYLAATDPRPYQPATSELQAIGVEVLYDITNVKAGVLERAPLYDAVLISRPHNATLIDVVLEGNPRAAIIYDAEALFTLRDSHQSVIEGRPLSPQEIERRLHVETALVSSADLVLSVSDREARAFEASSSHLRTMVWGHAVPVHAVTTSFKERQDLVFVGYLGSAPNDDALLHFLTEIFPTIRRGLSCRLLLVGVDASPRIQEVAASMSNAVTLLGFVDDLESIFAGSRVFVASHRFAAGIPLKVVEAMSYGMPCVVSSLLSEQLGVTDGVEALVASDANDFAQRVIRLYEDERLWQTIQEGALRFVRDHFDPVAMQERLMQQIDGCISAKQAMARHQ